MDIPIESRSNQSQTHILLTPKANKANSVQRTTEVRGNIGHQQSSSKNQELGTRLKYVSAQVAVVCNLDIYNQGKVAIVHWADHNHQDTAGAAWELVRQHVDMFADNSSRIPHTGKGRYIWDERDRSSPPDQSRSGQCSIDTVAEKGLE